MVFGSGIIGRRMIAAAFQRIDRGAERRDFEAFVVLCDLSNPPPIH